MKNCIFICVFHSHQYVNMLFLLLESIFLFGNLGDDIDILIYTSTEFMHPIKNSHLFCDKIKFEINDSYHTVEKACKARLDLFHLASVSNYDKILYLDTDIIIKKDIHPVFDIIQSNVLYVLEEFELTYDDGYYGGMTLFGEEIHHYPDTKAFTSGILLFHNCNIIKQLFDTIIDDMKKRPHTFMCHDQPYIVYNAFKYHLFESQSMKSFAVNLDTNIHSDKTIHHFPGGPGVHENKLLCMNSFLSHLKDYTIRMKITETKRYIDEHLMPIIKNSGELLEGNLFMSHHTTEYSDVYLDKVKNITSVALNPNVKSVLEIGFNAGFSTLLMLLSNPTMRITCVDLGEHSYTLPCYLNLKARFGNRIHFILGDSTKILPLLDECYDVIHIDGGHDTAVAESDILYSYRASLPGTIFIMDDYDFENLHGLWDKYVHIFRLQTLNIHLYETPHHDLRYRNRVGEPRL